jgi:hypothetical protein
VRPQLHRYICYCKEPTSQSSSHKSPFTQLLETCLKKGAAKKKPAVALTPVQTSSGRSPKQVGGGGGGGGGGKKGAGGTGNKVAQAPMLPGMPGVDRSRPHSGDGPLARRGGDAGHNASAMGGGGGGIGASAGSPGKKELNKHTVVRPAVGPQVPLSVVTQPGYAMQQASMANSGGTPGAGGAPGFGGGAGVKTRAHDLVVPIEHCTPKVLPLSLSLSLSLPPPLCLPSTNTVATHDHDHTEALPFVQRKHPPGERRLPRLRHRHAHAVAPLPALHGGCGRALQGGARNG